MRSPVSFNRGHHGSRQQYGIIHYSDEFGTVGSGGRTCL
jgi:hypothetical protein